MGVARGVGDLLTPANRVERFGPASQSIEGSGMVEVDVPVVRIRFGGPSVPVQRLLVVTPGGMLLGDAVEAERVVGLLIEQ